MVVARAVDGRSAVCGGVKVRCKVNARAGFSPAKAGVCNSAIGERTGIPNSLGAEIPFERDGRGSQISMERE